MKRLVIFLVALLSVVFFSACNTGEGSGGTATLEGNVVKVLHPDDVYTLATDTMPGAKEDVFLVYGKDGFYDDDVEADMSGHYRFKYLRPGTYSVYAYSTLATGEKVAVVQTVNVERGKTTQVPDLYIHEGKAYGTSMVKGKVMATYIDKDGNTIATGPAYEHRVYIQHAGDCFPCGDERVGMDGVFVFQKLTPGDYVVFTTSVFDEDEIPYLVQQSVSVEEPNVIVELPETFHVTIKP
ncbi:MAG: hypothetical protein IK013_05595 [Bacteroidales bacterium]|nr:hypothetical protein [Bacteroidales bacterium]